MAKDMANKQAYLLPRKIQEARYTIILIWI